MLQLIVTLVLLAAVHGHEYDMVAQSEDILEDCPSDPEHSFRNFVDLSNFTLRYSFADEVVEMGGQIVKIVDIDATDIVANEISLYKWTRGQWVPTLFSYSSADSCKEFFDPRAPWYLIWSRHIYEEDRQCLYPKGSVWRHNQVEAKPTISFPGGNIEGRYKVIVVVMIQSAKGVTKDHCCLEIKMDLYRT